MTNTNYPSRFDGRPELTQQDVEHLPYGNLLPDDFTDRLERLRQAAGLTWAGLAKAIGVDYKQMYRWKQDGTEPSGGAMHSLILFASRGARWTRHPHGRRVPDDVLQGLRPK